MRIAITDVASPRFLINYAVIDKIIHHLGVTFTCQRPPPSVRQEELY